jgi:benzil reductase ((S)-benzoin forming)
LFLWFINILHKNKKRRFILKTIVITGTSSGLGKAFFDIFTSKYYCLVCLSRRFLDYQLELARENNSIKLITQDLTDINTLKHTLKTLDEIIPENTTQLIFISNAGIVDPIGKPGTLKEEDIIQSLSVNLTAPLLISNKILEIHHKLKTKTIIINISSGAAERTIEGWEIYCTTKAGAKMFFDCTDDHYENDDTVKIYNVNPGVMDTHMQDRIRQASEEEFPQVDRYRKLKENDQLNSPESTADNIIDMCNI